MPKIRKKTSKRSTTRMREKIKHKVSEAHKKAKKNAKKDVTWKSRVKKDIGIPALFPFKDQVLAEQQQAKMALEEERRSRQNLSLTAAASASALAQSLNDGMDLDQPVSDEDQEHPNDPSLTSSSSIRAHAKSLQKVLALSDVLIEVLDARDPLGTRSLQLERDAVRQGKKVLLVLNKVDLVPKQNVDKWLTYLRRSWPTLPFKSSTQSQRNNLSSKGQASGRENSSTATASSIQPLMQLLKNYARRPTTSDPTRSSSTAPAIKSLASITVGIIGFPNVGKSSLINTLKRSRVCGVAPTPGFTKDVQEIALEKGLKVLDCPGVVLSVDTSDDETAAAHILRNAVKVEQILDPLPPVGVILKRCKTEHLMLLYNIPAFTFPGQSEDDRLREFLIHVSRSRGRIKKGGIPDLTGCARGVLRDWNTGRIPYYTVPPPLPKSQANFKTSTDTNDLGCSKILSEMDAEFDLEALFAAADREVLSGTVPIGSSAQTSVQMSCTEPVGDSNEELKLLGETEGDVEMDNEAVTTHDEPQSGPEIISLPPKKSAKQVNFATSITSTNSKAKGSSQFERMGIEAPIGENKQIAKQARKDRKKLAKKLKNENDSVDQNEITMQDLVQKPQPVAQDVDDALDQPYSFADFFHGTNAVARSF